MVYFQSVSFGFREKNIVVNGCKCHLNFENLCGFSYEIEGDFYLKTQLIKTNLC